MSGVQGQRHVMARIEHADSLAARLPALTGVVAVPRLTGWATRSFADLMTRVRGEIVRAVTARETRKGDLELVLQMRLDGAVQGARRGGEASAIAEVCKAWCIEHVRDPAALEALCDSRHMAMDGSVVSSVIDSASRFGEMGRSRVLSALADRVLLLPNALSFPEGTSKLLRAASELPWQAPGHEAIATAVVRLDRELFYEADPGDREALEVAAGVKLSDLVAEYAEHPRVAVTEEVAKLTERADVLRTIGERAAAVYEVDPRLTYRLVAALASNAATPAEVLHPFARAELWARGERERTALDALLSRAMGTRVPRAPAADPALSHP